MYLVHSKGLSVTILIMSIWLRNAASQGTAKGDLLADTSISTTATTDASTGDTLITYKLTNLYNKPLVAASYSFKCDGAWTGRSGHGNFDSALANSSTLLPNQVLSLTTKSQSCSFRLTSAVFANGRQDGEPESLELFRKRREWALARLQPFVSLVRSQTANAGSLDVVTLLADAEVTVNRIEKMTDENSERTGTEKLALLSFIEETRKLQQNRTSPQFSKIESTYITRVTAWLRALSEAVYPDGIPKYSTTKLSGEPSK